MTKEAWSPDWAKYHPVSFLLESYRNPRTQLCGLRRSHEGEYFTVSYSLGVKRGTGDFEELGVSLASKFGESQFITETVKKKKGKNPHLFPRSQSSPLRKAPEPPSPT